MNDRTQTKIQQLLDSRTPTVLFVGTKKSPLSQKVLEQPWSLIVTSSHNAELQFSFSIPGKRVTVSLEAYEDVLGKAALNRKHLNIIYIKGRAPSTTPLSTSERLRKEDAARDLLKIVADLVHSNFGSLAITGYDPENQEELSFKNLFFAIDGMRPGSVLMFDTPDDVFADELFQDMAAQNKLAAWAEPLADFLESPGVGESEDDEFQDDSSPNAVYTYIRGKRTRLDKKILFDTQGFARLLTESELAQVSIPPSLLAEYFGKFLRDSVITPVWYGYEYGFNLQRVFEYDLQQIVRRSLKNTKNRDRQKPIVVCGQTCSGKSIALCNIAYKTYKSMEHPVIYIGNRDVTFYDDKGRNSNFTALDALIYMLEAKDARNVLLIWDNSSTYTHPFSDSRRLYTDLLSRGRRVVIVSSAYEPIGSSQQKWVQENFEIVHSKATLATDKGNGINEPDALCSIITKNSDLSTQACREWFAAEEKHHHNLLALLYTLFCATFKKPIGQGVGREIKTLSVLQQLEELLKVKRPVFANQMQEALSKAMGTDNGNEQSQGLSLGEILDKYKNFVQAVAVVSQFNINIPLYTALRISGLEDVAEFSHIYGTLLDLPFLSPIEGLDPKGNDSEFMIRFRTPLEAKLYLEEELQLTPDQEVETIAKLILSIPRDSWSMYSEARVIDHLIRIIGPNSTISDPRTKNKIHLYKTYYDKIITALFDLRTKKRVIVPRLICQEVTWMREVYSRNENFDASDREEKLQEAINLATNFANHSVDTRTRGTLIVEKANSLWQLYKLRKKVAQKTGEPQPDLPYNFGELFDELADIIATSPGANKMELNLSFPYVALLKLFIDFYREGQAPKERKLEYLGLILALLDNADSSTQEHEEFLAYKRDVVGFVGEKEVDVYINSLVSCGKPIGVYLQSRRFLGEKDIDLTVRVPADKHTALHELTAYFAEHEQLVRHHEACLYQLLSVHWQLDNGTALFEGERQSTHMNRLQWENIASICRQYRSLYEQDARQRRGLAPTMFYMYALAHAQLGDFTSSMNAFKWLADVPMNGGMRVTVRYILSNEDGSSRLFKGSVLPAEDNLKWTRRIRIEEIPEKNGVFCRISNLKTAHIDHANFSDLEIGLNFIGFEAFRGDSI